LFQSTRPRGARRVKRGRGQTQCYVSIHAPARGATSGYWCSWRGLDCFNPRARAGRDDSRESNSTPACTFQSTRPRGARPFSLIEQMVTLPVSIHAPARGATQKIARVKRNFDVSIHAPARGATCGRGHITAALVFVSIHAPARGATRRNG